MNTAGLDITRMVSARTRLIDFNKWPAYAGGPKARRLDFITLLAEIAPELTGHGLPLSKCEA
jgi:hypothetical protein